MWEQRFHINDWAEAIYVNGRLIAYLCQTKDSYDEYFVDVFNKEGHCYKIKDKDYCVLKLKATLRLKEFGYNLDYNKLLKQVSYNWRFK